MSAARNRHPPGTAAQTTTLTDPRADAATPSVPSTRLPFPSGTTLRLRGEEEPEASREEGREQQQDSARAARPRVRWDESVVNNEGLGRKSSKGRSSSSLLLSLPNTHTKKGL